MMSDSSLKQLLRYFLILAVAGPADTQTVSFSARRDFPIGSGVYAGPYAVAVVDLNGDAGHYLRGERIGHTLQPTALVHEAFLRLWTPFY